MSCIVHYFHNVYVTIINNTTYVKLFIQLMNSSLSNNIKNVSFFKQIFQKSIPSTVVTRFGSYLQASFFIIKTFCVEKYLKLVLLYKPPGEKVLFYSQIGKILNQNLKNLFHELEPHRFQFITNYIHDLKSRKINWVKKLKYFSMWELNLVEIWKNNLNRK